jgi:hypothetical protein
MTFPSKVLVAPFAYMLKFVSGLPDAGNCDADHERILIQEGMASGATRDTVLHELIHACFGQGWMIRLKNIDKDLEEELVEALAPRLLALLRDNPKLVAYLTEKEG